MNSISKSSVQLGRFAARRLIGSNLRRPPTFAGSFVSSSESVSQFSWANANSNEARTYSNTNRQTYQPMGDLFQHAKEHPQNSRASVVIDEDFVGKTASIQRVFGPGANAQALLTCGGDELAQQASFDPDYETAKGWIRSRPVGPAVLSSTLVSGLVGALIEASFPQTVPVNNSLNFLHPLIVGMEVSASIRVEAVQQRERVGHVKNDMGYEILLSTQVTRVQDDVKIAEGHTTVWIPGYL